MNVGEDEKYSAYGFLSSVLELVRRDAEDDRPYIWTIKRLKIGIENAAGLLSSGKTEEALGKISEVVILLEET